PAGTLPQPAQGMTDALILAAEYPVAMIVGGRADQDEIGDVRITPQRAIAQTEQPAETPAVQSQATFAAVLANPFQHAGKAFGKVMGQPLTVVRPAGASPIDQVQLETPGA